MANMGEILAEGVGDKCKQKVPLLQQFLHFRFEPGTSPGTDRARSGQKPRCRAPGQGAHVARSARPLPLNPGDRTTRSIGRSANSTTVASVGQIGAAARLQGSFPTPYLPASKLLEDQL